MENTTLYAVNIYSFRPTEPRDIIECYLDRILPGFFCQPLGYSADHFCYRRVMIAASSEEEALEKSAYITVRIGE